MTAPANPSGSPDQPQGVIADASALLQAEIDRALLPASGRTADELARIAELDALPPLSDEELARQAAADPGADGDASTPE